MTSTTKKLTFRSVEEGKGGTFTFRTANGSDEETTSNVLRDRTLIQHVGTYGLQTCVGVYFQVSETQYFLAHIRAWLPGRNTGGNFLTTSGKGEELKSEVLYWLHTNSTYKGWSPKNNPFIASTLLLACPRLSHDDDDPAPLSSTNKQVGWWVIEAVREFLGLANVNVEQKSGFVVGITNGHKDLFAFRGKEFEDEQVDPPELNRYDEVEEEDVDDWGFTITPLR